MSKKLFVALTLCLSLLGSTNPILAQADQKTDEDVLSELQRQGWKIVGDGVLKRELRAGEVEHFVFGVGGFTWKIRDLQAQLRKLRAEFRAKPTPELRKAIANHRKLIASAQRARDLAKSTEDLGEVDLSKVSCTINFAYDAAAGPKTDVQGTWANASASFNANCGGFSGQVYALAFAKTYVNGAETTETVTDGPRSGANVSASAFASRNGGGPCESNSFGEMFSYSLNPSSYSKTASNYSCPFTPPPTVSVSMSPASSSGSPLQLYGYDCVTVTWTTSISSGTAPYTTTMYRNNVSLGNRTSYSELVCNAQSTYLGTITVRADVVDGAGKTGTDSKSAYVQHHYYQDPYEDPCFRDPRIVCN